MLGEQREITPFDPLVRNLQNSFSGGVGIVSEAEFNKQILKKNKLNKTKQNQTKPNQTKQTKPNQTKQNKNKTKKKKKKKKKKRPGHLV